MDTAVPKGKRELIIKAAEKVFSTKGFYQAKVEEIAAEAGVGKGTVYEYFSSKEEVFKEMLIYISREYVELLSERASGFRSAVDTIREIIEQHLVFMQERKDMARIFLQDHVTLSEDIHNWMKESRDNYLKSIEQIIIGGIDKGELRRDVNPMIVALLISGVTMSLSGFIIEEVETIDVKDLTDKMMDILLHGIISSAFAV